MHEELPDMRVGFGNGVRADRMDEPFVRLLAATKCYYIAIPIETASPRLQQVTRKHVDFDQVDRVLAWLRKYKVYAVGYFLIALPTETPDEMDATFRYAARPEFSFCGISSASPYPGTALRTMVDREIPASDLGDPDGVYDADAAPAELLKRRKHAILMNQIRRPENWFVLSNLFSWILWWHGVRGLIRYLACIARDALGGKNAVWADRHARDDRARVAATLRDSLA
jgi:radical SAM superfamily enzyme YgiQ (UPF0313 family)